MSTGSPFLRVRMSAGLLSAIRKGAKRDRTTVSDFVRRTLAEAVGDPDLAEMREPGRPADPAKTKAE